MDAGANLEAVIGYVWVAKSDGLYLIEPPNTL
jgi:hypothetical protein